MLMNEPLSMKNMNLHNRLVLPPMATAKSTPDGKVTEELCDYYRQRAAKGAIALIITEHSYICMQGKASDGQVSLEDDSCIPGLKQLADVIHEGGAKAIVQMNHAGSAAPESVTGCQAVSSSAIINPGRKPGLPDIMPHALTREEIAELEETFVQAALRVQAAGFDGVEIHSAHGYLLNQFYSPLTNERTDEYGPDSIENRTRFQVETLKKVRAAVGENFTIAIRLGGCDYMEGGSTIEDAVKACKIFEEAGADLLDLSGGMCRFTRPGHTEPGYFADMTEAIKKEVTIPVILTGGVTEMAQAEELMQAGKADLIGVGRAIYKDGDWAVKAWND